MLQSTLAVPAHQALACRIEAYGTPFGSVPGRGREAACVRVCFVLMVAQLMVGYCACCHASPHGFKPADPSSPARHSWLQQKMPAAQPSNNCLHPNMHCWRVVVVLLSPTNKHNANHPSTSLPFLHCHSASSGRQHCRPPLKGS